VRCSIASAREIQRDLGVIRVEQRGLPKQIGGVVGLVSIQRGGAGDEQVLRRWRGLSRIRGVGHGFCRPVAGKKWPGVGGQ
jgi:hypothetical protein